MPWLAATALLHSINVLAARGALKAWTMMLAVIAFSMSMVGTFASDLRSPDVQATDSVGSHPAAIPPEKRLSFRSRFRQSLCPSQLRKSRC